MTLSIEDRVAIQDLLHQYAHAMEEGEEADVVALFTTNPVIQSEVHGDEVGVAAVKALARRTHQHRHQRRVMRMMSNFRFEGDGEQARVVAYFAEFFTWLTPKPNNIFPETELLYAGQYDCDVRKVEGRWLIQRRAVRVESRAKPRPAPDKDNTA